MNIIRSKLLTEKSTRLETSLVYSFEVARVATKSQISQTIFDLYGKRPLSVKTSVRPGKQYRAGKARRMFDAPDRKIAYVHMGEALNVNTKL